MKSSEEHYDTQDPNVKRVGSYFVQTKYILGQGEFGRVYEGRHCITNERVAVKQINMKQISKDQYAQQSLKMEIEALKKISHANVVELKEQYLEQDYLYLIQEHCKDGELKDYINKFSKIASEDYERICIDIARQIAEGMRCVHDAGVIHRDLKPQNILVHNQRIKIIDFGFAKSLVNQGHMIRSAVGSPYYMSPQILAKQPYTYKTDIWSFGMIYYELVFQKLPYFANSEEELLGYIRQSPINFPALKCTQTTKEVLSRALVINEQERANWEEIHSILKAFVPNSVQQQQQSQSQLQSNQSQNQVFSITSNASFASAQLPTGRKNVAKKTIFQALDNLSLMQNMQAELTHMYFLGQLMLEVQQFVIESVPPEVFFKCLMACSQHLTERSENATKMVKATNEQVAQQQFKDTNLIAVFALIEDSIGEISEFTGDVQYHCAKYKITSVNSTLRELLSSLIIAISKSFRKEQLLKFDTYMQRQILTFIDYAAAFLNSKQNSLNYKEVILQLASPESTEQYCQQVYQVLSRFQM